MMKYINNNNNYIISRVIKQRWRMPDHSSDAGFDHRLISYHNNYKSMGSYSTSTGGISYKQHHNTSDAAAAAAAADNGLHQNVTKKPWFSLLYPFPRPKTPTSAIELQNYNTETSCQIIYPGLYLLKNHISLADQAAAFHSPSMSYLNHYYDMNNKQSGLSFRNNKSLLGTTFASGNCYNQHRDICAAADAGNGVLKKTRKRKRKPYSLIFLPIDKNLTTEEDLKLHNTQTSHQILGPGMILLKNHISLADQVEIVEICQEFSIHPAGYFRPRNPRNYRGREGRDPVQMMCFGKDWDPKTKYDVPAADDRESPEAPPIPDKFISLAETALKEAQAHLNSEDHQLPSMSPDTCIVNFYDVLSRLLLHQDCDESADSLERGLPVVSISVGDTAEFLYGHTSDEKKANKILLESGDVLIFGGKSRHIFHGVKRISAQAPDLLMVMTSLKPGRLNLTFRQV